MSIIDPVPRHQLGTRYTHRGWLLGLVPIYIGDADSECPLVNTRNGIPDFALQVVLGLFCALCFVAGLFNPAFEPSFPIVITGTIDPP